MKVSNTSYLVNIPICVYNHEKYIGQTIESILNQKTNFNYLIIIGEDCSSDKSKEIIQYYSIKYPEKIKGIFHSKNLGAQLNSLILFNECNAKYVALCDGDDYWTDPLKLQKQVDFLEANEDYAICFSGYKTVNQIIGQETLVDNIGGSISIEQIINSNSYSTATAMFVSKYLYLLPSWFDNIKFGDWGLYLNTLFTSKKKAYCLPDITAVYRIHKGGIHGNLHASNLTLIKAYKMHIQFYRQIQTYLFRDEYSAQIKDCIKARKGIIARLLKEEKKYLAAIISKWY